MQRYEHNAATGETFFVDLSPDQVAEIKTKELAAKAETEAEATKAAEKAALLAKLGITEDEAKLLLS